MTYGHAERALDAIRRLEAETVALLHRLPELDTEQAGWLREVSRQRDLPWLPCAGGTTGAAGIEHGRLGGGSPAAADGQVAAIFEAIAGEYNRYSSR
jgi:hypothetical protein